jgi:serine/threonine protein kinase
MGLLDRTEFPLDQIRFDNAAYDAWGFGMVICELVMGHRPWEKPIPEIDDFYRYYCSMPYCRRSQFFRDIFPLSIDAAEILAGLLNPLPERRMSLKEAYRRISKLDTWYMTPAELAKEHELLRRWDTRYGVRGRRPSGQLFTPPTSPLPKISTISASRSAATQLG